jgi:predicted nucleotide-binding protein
MSLAARFQGSDGLRHRIEALHAQGILCGDPETISEVAALVAIQDVAPGELLIRQASADNDVYFILSGTFRVLVNDRDVAVRKGGDHVGEMAAIDPSCGRTATVIASAPSVVAKLDEANFVRLADKNPRIWRQISLALCRRLDQRRQFHVTPNGKPIVFVGSSTEYLSVAEAVAKAIPSDTAVARLWSENVFRASSFPIDDLTAQLRVCDFAVLVAGADDKVISRGKRASAPRDNVTFELGLFMGALSRQRTFLIEPLGAGVKLPSDLKGINTLGYDPAIASLATAIQPAVTKLLGIIEQVGVK